MISASIFISLIAPAPGARCGRKPLALLLAFSLLCLLARGAAVEAQVGDEGSTDRAPFAISEFRLRGPDGPDDEFIEIYNNSDAPVTVSAADGSSGYALVASEGAARFVIPNGTVIPARGHYLGVNSVGYSLAAYPAAGGATASGDAAYTQGIPDNAGLALFATSNPSNFTPGNRLDAVGSTSEGNALYKEGAGYPALIGFSVDYSLVRHLCPAPMTCAGRPQDSTLNEADFIFVDTNGTNGGMGQRLGAPGPEGLSSPIRREGTGLTASLLDPNAGVFSAPNYVRYGGSDPANNSTFGTVVFRRAFTNNTASDVTRLRFRVANLTTFPAPEGTADLRTLTSGPATVTLADGGTAAVQGTTLEGPPAQPNGGGFNSSMSADSIALSTPLAPGASVNLQLVAGVQQTGDFTYCVTAETLPAVTTQVLCFTGNKSRRALSVVVPRNQSNRWLDAVNAQADAARQHAEANNGAPPPGYFRIGDGPVIGPFQ